jgi:hypothetical protein
VSKVRLARVTGAVDVPRGPDVKHRIRVPGAWLDEAATIEFALPRNLSCAACGGGGCDRCERSGAISLRGRKDPAEVVRVTLPQRGLALDRTDSGRGIVVRIPERGGLADRADLPRGILMLSVQPDHTPDPGIERVSADRPMGAPEAAAPALEHSNRRVIIAVVVLLLWILLLVWLRATGRA